MCGIAGKVYEDKEEQVSAALLRQMCQTMVHRGPDDEGFYLEQNVGLCMRRLQVIDLEGGHQPMANEDQSLWVVFNGEIYNYQELRRELEARGHHLRTASDTEVILHLFEDEGIDCLQRLRGMFALAIWDSRGEKLFLARDRLGKKPLYYAPLQGALSFASELGVLACDRQVDTTVDPAAIDEYLTYLFVPHPRTIYRGALADVPVGAFLSGGLDSSLIVALMQELGGRRVKTFSIGFEDSSFSELHHARQVARALDTDHEEFTVSYQVQELLPQLLEHFGEPFADSSAIPTYHLSKLTRKQVTVALSGDGGDEGCGGYRRYQARLLAGGYNRWPAFLGRGLVDGVGRIMREPATYYGTSLSKKFKRFTEFAAMVREAPQTSWAFFLPSGKKMRCMRKILPII